MRLKDIITEHYVNLFEPNEKLEYADRVFELVQTAYAPIGGHVGIPDVDTMIRDTNMWKLVRRGGQIVVAVLYKDNKGRKMVAIGHDGTTAAKEEFKKIIIDDIKRNRMWAEVSGGPARSLVRAGVPLVPNKYAAELTGKEILSFDGEYKYTRLLGGHAHTKVIVGYPNGEKLGDEGIAVDEIIDHLP